MKKLISAACILFSIVFFVPHQAAAQRPAPSGGGQSGQGGGGVAPGIQGFWEIESAGGKFVARIDHITSVSEHQYYIDAALKVYECTVDTAGGMTARFYYIEPTGAASSTISNSNTYNRLKELANRASNKAGEGDSEHIVTKHYPDTTHAKTAEFRFKYKESISKIYKHVHKVWAEERGRGKGNKITIRE